MKIEKFIPLDKSWIIRMGVLDIINGYDDIIKFLDNQKILGDDLIALKRIAKNWNTNDPLDVGESGTLYRFIRFILWKQRSNREIIKQRTLKDRNICYNQEIINWPLNELLKLDNKTSQWASASVLAGNNEKIENPPHKLKVTYEAVKHWKEQRQDGKVWQPKYDETIKAQALAYLRFLKIGKMYFIPKHSEDYCFARAFNLMTPEQAKEKWPSLLGHESNRIEEMENSIQQAELGQEVSSNDHRVIQAIVMRYGKDVKVQNKNCVNKSWPQFWSFLEQALNTRAY